MKKLIETGVYLVGVPIGNYQDITLRALEILKNADLILCEDSRETKLLLDDFLINVHCVSYIGSFDYAINSALKALQASKVVVIVSDRGMPCISDPGANLVSYFRSLNYKIKIVPGVSAVTTAFALTGLSGGFVFGGFLSKKKSSIITELNQLLSIKSHLMFFESSHRIMKTLKIFDELIPDHTIYILRELTKTYEEVLIGSAAELLNKTIQGEIVIIIENK